MHVLLLLLPILRVVYATLISSSETIGIWPDTPFLTNGSRIQGESGRLITFAGVNWPGAGLSMLPEGLQYQSIRSIVKNFKQTGFNIIRLTYAIEMIDIYLDNGLNSTLEATLTNALGQENGTNVLRSVLHNNPQFSALSTPLDVFDAIAQECAEQQIWIHLDNHVSKASWCCSETDGNAWFGDEYFNVSSWQRGLGFMAHHVKGWKAIASMSLRNELRHAKDRHNRAQKYDWQRWFENMMPAAMVVHGNNSDPLIFLSGLDYDTDVGALARGQKLGGGHSLHLAELSQNLGNKVVFEVHEYSWDAPGSDCSKINKTLNAIYGTMDETNAKFTNHAPVVMSEFGFDMTDNSYNGSYAQCLLKYLPNVPGGPGSWMIWVGTGSYYIRDVQDQDENFAILNHNGTGYRNLDVINNYVTPLIEATLQL